MPINVRLFMIFPFARLFVWLRPFWLDGDHVTFCTLIGQNCPIVFYVYSLLRLIIYFHYKGCFIWLDIIAFSMEFHRRSKEETKTFLWRLVFLSPCFIVVVVIIVYLVGVLLQIASFLLHLPFLILQVIIGYIVGVLLLIARVPYSIASFLLYLLFLTLQVLCDIVLIIPRACVSAFACLFDAKVKVGDRFEYLILFGLGCCYLILRATFLPANRKKTTSQSNDTTLRFRGRKNDAYNGVHHAAEDDNDEHAMKVSYATVDRKMGTDTFQSKVADYDTTVHFGGRTIYTGNAVDHAAKEDTDGKITTTQWIWYWKDEHHIWRKYGVDQAGRDLQQAIEGAFLSKQHGFRFRIADQNYRMKFYPEYEMSQTNVKYGTTRNVRRRRAKFVSSDDIQTMKRSKTMLPAKQLPAHWSSMSSEIPYERVQLSPLSDEFKDVQKLFTKSIKKIVEILRIERVQNPFMWEKYQRKKENMSAEGKASINEKRLFHGTSPNAVEAICKQNFDWRMHGKNATRYGKGSYFALNSSYSDSYASEDDNSSRFMFVAKVLVGCYAKGQSSYRRPPAKDPSNPASDLYDCCVDNTESPSIFVVFDTDQFYPEYIVEYSVRQANYFASRAWSTKATYYFQN